MDEGDHDALIRMAAFEHVRWLNEVHDHLSASELKPGFIFDGERIPLIRQIEPDDSVGRAMLLRLLLSREL